jgi:hypothetical protein
MKGDEQWWIQEAIRGLWRQRTVFHIFADRPEHTRCCQPAAPTGLAISAAALINQMEFQLAELAET